MEARQEQQRGRRCSRSKSRDQEEHLAAGQAAGLEADWRLRCASDWTDSCELRLGVAPTGLRVCATVVCWWVYRVRDSVERPLVLRSAERASAQNEMPSLESPEHAGNEARFKQENAEFREMLTILRAQISGLKGAAGPAPAEMAVSGPVEHEFC